MAWRRMGAKPLSEPMLSSSLAHIHVCGTRGRWGNASRSTLVGSLSNHKFAHATTAELSWHVQNCDLIGADRCFVRKVLGFDKFKKVSAAGLCIVFAIGHVSYLGGHYWDYFMGILSYCSSQCYSFYRKTSTISRTFVGNKIVDHSGVGAAPTTSSFST